MKRAFSILIVMFLLTSCASQVATTTPVSTPVPASPTLKAFPSPKSPPTVSPTPLVTSTPETILDTVCNDVETFDYGTALHPSDSGSMRMGNGQLYGVDWSRDGSQIAIASETGIYIFDSASLQQIQYIETPHVVETVRFSPDGTLIATDDYSQVAVWDIANGKLVSQFGSDIDFRSIRWVYPIRAQMGNISFHPDGTKVVIHSMNYVGGNASPSIEIWDIQAKAPIETIRTQEYVFPDPVFSPDGKWIASSWSDGVTVWNAETLEEFKHIQTTARFAYFSPDSNSLVLSEGTQIRILSLLDGTSISLQPGGTYEPLSGFITSDGKKLVTHYTEGSEPYTTPVAVWDLESGKKLLELNSPDFVMSLITNPVRNELVTIGYSKDHVEHIRVWDLETGDILNELIFSRHLGNEIALSPDGTRLIVERDKHFHLYNTKTGGYLCALQKIIDKPYYLSFSADGKKMAFITLASSATVWDLETGREEQVITSEQVHSQNDISEGLLVFNTTPFENKYWNLVAWAWKYPHDAVNSWIINTCDASTSIPTDCPGSVSPDKKRILVIDDELVIKDAVSQEVLGKLNESRGPTNFTFSPDGRYILALSYLDWTIAVWDAKTFQKITTINSGMEGEGPILGNQEFSFTMDGKRLATYLPYFHQGSVRLWNTRTWRLESSFDTKAGVGDVAISGNGKLLAGLSGYVIYLWNLNN